MSEARKRRARASDDSGSSGDDLESELFALATKAGRRDSDEQGASVRCFSLIDVAC